MRENQQFAYNLLGPDPHEAGDWERENFKRKKAQTKSAGGMK